MTLDCSGERQETSSPHFPSVEVRCLQERLKTCRFVTTYGSVVVYRCVTAWVLCITECKLLMVWRCVDCLMVCPDEWRVDCWCAGLWRRAGSLTITFNSRHIEKIITTEQIDLYSELLSDPFYVMTNLCFRVITVWKPIGIYGTLTSQSCQSLNDFMMASSSFVAYTGAVLCVLSPSSTSRQIFSMYLSTSLRGP